MNQSFWGVDFGTTTTYLSTSERVGDNLIHIGRVGDAFIPSVAGFDDEKLLFCEDTARLDETYKIRSIKYLITRGLGSTPANGVSEATDLVANRYKLTKSPTGEDGQWLEAASSSGPKTVEVGEIIQGIFRTMIGRAELEGETLSTARMGCPAMWDGDQRRRLMDYAKKAGLTVEDGTLIDEPIAACINWIEQNRDKDINGNALIFDMGGGTLDVSMIHVKTPKGEEPIIYVLSSMGRSEAGNQFDWHISKKIIEKVAGQDVALRSKLFGSIGWVDLVARQLKENLLDYTSAAGTLNIPGLDPIPVKLGRDEIRSAIQNQMDDAMTLVHDTIRAGMVTGIDTSKLTNEEVRRRAQEFSNLPKAETLPNVDYFVLAGGMVRMPLVKEILISHGVPASKIVFADRQNPGEAIARGLGSGSIYQKMNLHIPSFSFFLHWVDTETDQAHNIPLYKAHTRLAPINSGHLDSTDYIFRFTDYLHKFPKRGYGSIYALSIDDKRLEFELDGEITDGLEFEFGYRKEPVFKISATGEIFIRDTSENLGQPYKVSGWPIVRNENSSTIKLKRVQRTDSRTGKAEDESLD